MNTVLTTAYGNPDNLQLVAGEKKPLAAHTVLVNNQYFSINPVDCKVRQGAFKLLSGRQVPEILGADFSGIVDTVGNQVSDFEAGDRVVGMLNPFKGGAYTESVYSPDKQLVKVPDNVSLQQAAAIPLAGLTALQSLSYVAKLKPGETVLINGATGGVGHLAVQIARLLKARVIAVCHPDKASIAEELGADQVLSYESDFLAGLNNIDVFFDVAANRSFAEVKASLNKKGRYITTLAGVSNVMLDPLINLFRDKKSLFIGVKPSADDLATLMFWLANQELRVLIDQTLPMSDIREAHRIMESGHITGKLICQIQGKV